MSRDATALFARADRLRRGEGFTQDDVDRVMNQERVWRPCAGTHHWRLIPGNGGHRCARVACRAFSSHGDRPASCPDCKGPTCTSDGRCPNCGGVYPAH